MAKAYELNKIYSHFFISFNLFTIFFESLTFGLITPPILTI